MTTTSHQSPLEPEPDQVVALAHKAAHDLRSPLGTINNISQLLQIKYAAALDERGRDCLAMMQDASRRAERLVSGLVSYIDGVSGAPAPAIRVSAAKAAAESIKSLEPEVQRAGATIVTHAPLPDVTASSEDLERIFEELVRNALVHSGEAKPQIVISAQRETNFVRFSVSDNGPGIAPEHRDAVFEPLTRLHGPEVPGAGLGLAITRVLVARRKGRVWIESGSPAGCSVNFTLPAWDAGPYEGATRA